MNKYLHKLVLLACFTLLASAVYGQRQPIDSSLIMDFEVYDPISTLVVPENPVTSAKFKFLDIHSHHWRINDVALNMGALVNLSGRGGKRLKTMMDIVNQHPQKDRFIVFTNIELRSIDDPSWTENTVKQLEFDVANGARGLKIYKSQGMSNRDSSGNRIAIDDPRIDAVWAKYGELGIPVLIHSADPASFWKPHDETNERWLELKLKSSRNL